MKYLNSCHLSHPEKLFIGGEWVPPQDGGRLELVSPHHETVAAHTACAGRLDMDDAVVAAREAFDKGPWPRLSPAERAVFLGKLQAELAKRAEDLSLALTLQTGTLWGGSQLMTGLGSMLL